MNTAAKLSLGLSVALLSTAAQSATFNFTDTVSCADGAPVNCETRLLEGQSYTYYHDLAEFGVPSNQVTEATFNITFMDDGNASDSHGSVWIYQWDFRESMHIDFDAGTASWDINGGGDIIAAHDTTPTDFSWSVDIAPLLNDGWLEVTLQVDNPRDRFDWCGTHCTLADVFFVQSEITGTISEVPVPGALGLFTLSLAALGITRRKRAAR